MGSYLILMCTSYIIYGLKYILLILPRNSVCFSTFRDATEKTGERIGSQDRLHTYKTGEAQKSRETELTLLFERHFHFKQRLDKLQRSMIAPAQKSRNLASWCLNPHRIYRKPFHSFKIPGDTRGEIQFKPPINSNIL